LNVGYHYHQEAVFGPEGSARIPSHLGLLLHELAVQAGSVTFYAHGGPAVGNEDFVLSEPLIRCIDLGPRRSFPARTFWPYPALRRFRPTADGVDVMLIQSPTPLLPYFVRKCRDVPVALLVWGDYGAWMPRPSAPRWRSTLIKGWIKYYSAQQRRAANGRLAFIQNPTLAPTVRGAETHVVPFSSLSESSIPTGSTNRDWSPAKGRKEPVRLLYSGRIVREKGLLEVVDSLRILADQGYLASFEIWGWDDPRDLNLDVVMARAEARGVKDRVRFLGYRPAGEDLLRAYAEADIFVIATYWDSLPRSMQEAMAVGLPVVATAVGGIGASLLDRETAMLIEPRQAGSIAAAVRALVDDPLLRRRVAEQGQTWARRYTIESNCAEVVATLRARALTSRAD
jgi:glycosyltransferase involved in cell wall biosynthesis